MRKLTRPELSVATIDVLVGLYNKVDSAAQSVIDKGADYTKALEAAAAKAEALWDAKKSSDLRKTAFDEIQEKLNDMSSGHGRCMYCEDSSGTDIEHFWPKASFPWFAFVWENYLWACSYCNSNSKRELFPLSSDGEILLINPVYEDPKQYLEFIPTSGMFVPINDHIKGITSIDTFDLNGKNKLRSNLPKGRSQTFRVLQTLIIDYNNFMMKGNYAEARLKKEDIQSYPFSYVLDWLLRIAQDPDRAIVLRPGVADAIRQHNMASWL